MSHLGARAATADSALVEHRSLWRLVDVAALQNPALHGAAYQQPLSELALGFDGQWQSEAFVEELGTGFALPYMGVDTYLRLSDATAVWGAASYTAGTQRNIKWNSTSDFELLQPYVLADTMGGNTHRERYTFAGGYATRIGRWLAGGEMLFRAEQEYRDRDPRMRGIVTDLTLRAGAARRVGQYEVGAAVEANIYKQTNSVAFYNEEGVIPEYQMTGLGSEYARFSGDKRSIYYEGGGMALRLSVLPQGCGGLFADAVVDEHRYHRKLAEYNSMPLTDLYREHAGLTAGWRHEEGSRLALFGTLDYTRRLGDEHVGGTSDARYFPVIARLTMYRNHLLDTKLHAVYGQRAWNVAAHGGFQRVTEKYVYPHRQLDYSRIGGGLCGQCFVRALPTLLLKLDVHADYVANVGSNVTMPYANMDADMTAMVNHKRDYALASYATLGGSVRGDYAVGGSRYGLFALLGGGAVFCSVGQHQADLHCSIGITF